MSRTYALHWGVRGFDWGLIGHDHLMIRRMMREAGTVAIAGFLWQHRGSVVRGFDLTLRLPQLVSGGRTDEALTEAKAILALDGEVPTSIDVRISGIEDGAVTLRGGLDGESLKAARQALLGVSDVLDVRTDAGGQPTFDDALGAAAP